MSNEHGEILAFSTKGCTYCRIAQPRVERYGMDRNIEVRKVYADSTADEAQALCEQYNIQSVPVVVLGHGTEEPTVLRGFQQIMNYMQE